MGPSETDDVIQFPAVQHSVDQTRGEAVTTTDAVEDTELAGRRDGPLPFGYSWTMGEWANRQQEQSREFLINLLLALGLVFAVMAGLFESVRQAFGLMVALPFALAGAFWALWATGTDFDQPAGIGLLLLIGVVVNNGIVMIEHINLYRRQGMDRDAAMLKGG